MDEDELFRELRDFLEQRLLGHKVTELHACALASNVLEQLLQEYDNRIDGLLDEDE